MKNKYLLFYLTIFFWSNQIISQSSVTPQPVLNAIGDQIYCAGTDLKIATSFSITPSSLGETGQPAIYIQISEGYSNGQDILTIANPSNHPNVKFSFSAQFGKLTIESVSSGGLIDYNDIEKALLDVIFRTNSNSAQTRKFSITIGQADYLPSNDHYYKYIPFPTNSAGNVIAKSWTDSRAEAETLEYYGRKGYLVTLRSQAEAILASEQAPGRGWIGASDANQEGKWEWVTEPGGSVHFWDGNYRDGNGPCDNLVGNCQSVNGEYNNWARGEPNDFDPLGGEDYGHIYNNGTWNDYPNFRSDISGYVVEFGGRSGEIPLTITDFTQIEMPQIISVIENEICGSGQVTLSAETNTKAPNDQSNDVRIEWYDQPTGGTLIETTKSGENFITPVISATTEYFIQAVKFDGTSYCSTSSTRQKITATFSPKPLLVNIPDVEQCNDIVFDLDDLRDDISANYTNETFEFFDSSGNLIPQADWSTYELPDLTVSNEELITVVVKNDPSLGSPCDQTTSFTLRAGVCEIPTSFPVTDEITCETDPSPLGNNQDGIETFANAPTFFSTLKSDLETANPLFLTAGTVITFYKSSADATAGAAANAINTTVAYTTDPNDPGNTFNTAEDRWEQEIWVRVENPTLTTPCVDTQLVGRFIINKLPELKVTSYAVKQCDDPLFNLTTLESDLAVSHGSLTFEWFDSNGNAIPNPIQYEIPNRALQETITVEISTNPTLGSSCVSSTIIDIDLQWLPTTPPPGFDPTKHDQYTIETDPDPTGQGQDGVETFSNAFFAAIQNDIETLDPRLAGKSFAFYRSQRDAQIKDDEINTSIDFTTNPDPAKQGQWWDFNTAENRWEYHIWVYVSDAVTTAINTCYLLEKVATVYVEKRPIVYPVVDQELCDDGTTSGEKLDKKSVFDTSAIFTELITDPLTGTAQNNTLFTVEYSYIDAAGNPATSSELPDSSNLFNSSSQTVTVTFTNNTTNTAGLPGSSTGTIDFIVYDTPVAYPTDTSTGIYEITECDDLASGADDDGATLFDITGLEDLLLTDPNGIDPAQVSANYDFIFTDSSGNPITLTSDYRAEDGDTIDVSITNPLFTSCSETITVVFTVNPLPTFTVDPDAIVCIGPTAQPIEIGVDSFLDDYDYSWVYNGTIYNNPAPTSPNNDRILVDNGGTYEVTATDKITGCERTLSINVTESAIATITEDDITVEDLTNDNNNTITIDTTNLGIGDYEFAIDDAFGPYQDDPLFEQVEPGIHTIYIRDKNGCGLAQIQVSVIGYKKFFTPNNDGYNDTWKVLGIRPGYQETSKVYIFDRYGKLIKELDPLREGWDGTYLGRPMPQTDYWFRVFLEDGREFKGHFSLIRGRK